MFPRLMILLAIILTSSTAAAAAATRTTFEGQMVSLAKQIQDTMSNDPRLKNQAISLGEFRGEGEATGTNFGLRIERALQQNLDTLFVPKAKFTLAGSYVFAASEDSSTPQAKVLVITAQIKDERGREVKPISVEVNDTDGISRVLGMTAAIPAASKTTFSDRNQKLQEAQAHPAFETIDERFVTAVGAPELGMSLLKKSDSAGITTPAIPENVNGQAFVSIDAGAYYEIELVNHDSIAVVAVLTVDGLDVANTFATDRDSDGELIHWPGYLLPAGESMMIRGWLHTTNPLESENLFSFRVVELGQGAASSLKARGGIGVITVQFREAFLPGARVASRGSVETAKGEGLQESLKAQAVQIGDHVLSTVSIRYNRPRN